MSTTAAPQTDPAEHAHGEHDPHHGHHDHGPFFAHHFESWKQQFDAGKLGMWAFLVQEVLFFSGLFTAYAIFRTLHPDVFEYADQFLSVPHGALNTVVLLFSSLTMAWAVRCAMLGQQRGLIICLAITLACAALFLGVKAYEYTEKFHLQLVWAGADPLSESPARLTGKDRLVELSEKDRVDHEHLDAPLGRSMGMIEFGFGLVGLLALAGAVAVRYLAPQRLGLAVVFGAIALSAVSIVVGAMVSMGIHHAMHSGHGDHAAATGHDAEHAAGEPSGHGAPTATDAIAESGAESHRPERLGTFFGIYYAMTGVHALHIIGGMVVITWLLVRAFKNHFTPHYFGPVDFVGLYWHLVDLIWIYLFPLLYLIG